MIVYRVGDMRDYLVESDIFIFSANATIKNNGELVMGAGLAKQVKDTYTELPLLFGKYIQSVTRSGGFYGTVIPITEQLDHPLIIPFQVKYNWWEKANLELIKKSARTLDFMLLRIFNDKCIINMNFPGIGNGGLHKPEVIGRLDSLKNSTLNYNIWTLK